MALHMVVMTHSAESCGHRNAENRTAFGEGFRRLGPSAASHGAVIVGAWMNSAAHRHYLVIDAVDAHTVNTIIGECGLASHVTSEVMAVEDFAGLLVAAAE